MRPKSAASFAASLCYNEEVLLSLANDFPQGSSTSYFERFQREQVLERLKSLAGRAREEGLAGLSAAFEPLVALGMECDAAGRPVKNRYGVFDLAW